jgi:hypothetical protein
MKVTKYEKTHTTSTEWSPGSARVETTSSTRRVAVWSLNKNK